MAATFIASLVLLIGGWAVLPADPIAGAVAMIAGGLGLCAFGGGLFWRAMCADRGHGYVPERH